MITGSHNPPEYNGFKISVGKTTIFGAEIKALEKIIAQADFQTGAGKETRFNIFDKYISRYKQEFGKLRNIPIVLDCGNGSAGCIARQLYESVGLTPNILFEEPDGRFPNHHPDPTVEENLVDLAKAVKASGSIVGIGFDGDADRIGIVDENGSMVYGDELIALCARFVLEKNPGQKIIGDVKCSDRLYHYIEKYGGHPIMWKTGHSLIKEKIKVEKAPFGGELSGHVFFADRNYGYDDALYAGLRVVEILAKTGKTIRELLSDMPPAFNTPEIRIETTEEKKNSIVAVLKKHFEKPTDEYSLNLIDGIRISFRNGWALARASNTQPVLVLRFESSTAKGLVDIQRRVEAIVNPLL
jgi:phosphomannomutase / phosphoglucomutase